MSRKSQIKKAESEKEPAVATGKVSKSNPSGIEAVSEKRATEIGQLRGFGGPGAAGATVAGPEVHVATEGGTKPLPLPVSQIDTKAKPEEENEDKTGTDD